MSRLSPATLDELCKQMIPYLEVRFKDEFTPGRPLHPYHLLVCGGTGCHATKSIEVMVRLRGEIEERGIQDKAIVVETGRTVMTTGSH